jgi:hypothetical protein
MARTAKKTTRTTRTRRVRKAGKALRLEDLVAMLGLVHQELGLITAGLDLLIHKAGVDGTIHTRMPQMLVGPYCYNVRRDELGDPPDRLSAGVELKNRFEVGR